MVNWFFMYCKNVFSRFLLWSECKRMGGTSDLVSLPCNPPLQYFIEAAVFQRATTEYLHSM